MTRRYWSGSAHSERSASTERSFARPGEAWIRSRSRPAAAAGRRKSWLREGALAEISHHWSQLTPRPSKPVVLHRLGVSAERRLRLLRANLEELDVDMARYATINYERAQEIGAAVAFLGCDGLIVPCVRWECENLVILIENHALTSRLEVLSSEEVDWQAWARDAGFFDASGVGDEM